MSLCFNNMKMICQYVLKYFNNVLYLKKKDKFYFPFSIQLGCRLSDQKVRIQTMLAWLILHSKQLCFYRWATGDYVSSLMFEPG